MRYDELVDTLMQKFASGEFAGEAVQAKHEFNEMAGIFDENSPLFEAKMAQFTDWYLFSRPLRQHRMAPVQLFAGKMLNTAPEDDRPLYRNLADNRYSLFEFLKLDGGDLHVRDYFSEYRLTIRRSPVVHGFNRDEPFQARLIPHEDSFTFSHSFLFHPPEGVKFILQEVKKILKMKPEEQKAARESLLMRLMRMRYKFEQYRHVGIKEIYSNESRLGI